MPGLVMTPNKLYPINASHIVGPSIPRKGDASSAQGQHSHGVRPPNLSEIERLVLLVLEADGDWVLIDRNRAGREYNDSSARNIALRRRGFEVTSRHVNGVRNYWARWTHGQKGLEPPLIPKASTDTKNTVFGIDLA